MKTEKEVLNSVPMRGEKRLGKSFKGEGRFKLKYEE